MSSDPESPPWSDETLAVRAGFERSSFGEHAEPIITTSSFVFDSAEQAAARFSGDEPGLIYSRFTNPTVQMFERRLAALEHCEACIAMASGMAATSAMIFGLLQQGDHVIATRNMFGSTVNLFKRYLPRFGVQVSWADSFAAEEWERLITPSTRLLYVETPTNPLMEVADIRALAEVAHAGGARLAVDNCFCTPALQRPVDFGADIVIHSATKYLDGQGRCVGGAVAGTAEMVEELTTYMRSAGPCMSPFNAWVFLKSLETLSLRMRQHCANALQIARWLEQQPQVTQVYYPGLESHPQYALASRQQKGYGGVLSFRVTGGRAAAWKLIDHTRLCSITGNLGDSRTIITHPASTTHGRMSAEDRAAVGISDDLLRLSVGLESADDVQADLAQALRA